MDRARFFRERAADLPQGYSATLGDDPERWRDELDLIRAAHRSNTGRASVQENILVGISRNHELFERMSKAEVRGTMLPPPEKPANWEDLFQRGLDSGENRPKPAA